MKKYLATTMMAISIFANILGPSNLSINTTAINAVKGDVYITTNNYY